MSEIKISINPGRVLFGLSKIGYTPASALCDIIDNAVMAGAKSINILVNRHNKEFTDSKRGNVKEYLIIDNGVGMTREMMLNALTLGSSETFYANNSLSKFGLRLKSATFSQGDTLELISGRDGHFLKFKVNLPAIQARDEYFATQEDLNIEDLTTIAEYLSEGHGTIVKIGDVRKEGHPSIRTTTDELNKKVGVIYYYFIKDDNVSITMDNKPFPAIDVLFTEEANENENLNEHEWEGKEVSWIMKPDDLILDIDTGIKGRIEVTQLPHPPTFTITRGGDKAIRDKYFIGAGNYGYYVYRNKRLISWAETFPSLNEPIIPQDQDMYSFRGRILIGNDADEAFNVDVKKSSITLSDDAWNSISDITKDLKKKSKNAWKNAGRLKAEKEGQEPNQTANQIVEPLEIPDMLPGVMPIPDDTIIEVQKEIETSMKRRIEREKKRVIEEIEESNSNGGEEQILTEEEIFETALKGEINPYATKIFRVRALEDNKLWEPYYDTENGHCVRINKLHRFAKLIFEDNIDNTDLQVLFELILHQLALSEVETIKYLKPFYSKITTADLQNILSDYRKYTSEYLANMCRHLEDKLPPLKK